MKRRTLLRLLAATTAWSLSSSRPSSAMTLQHDLYQSRLLFRADGRPLIAVGMMQQQQRVVARSKGAITLEVDDATHVVPANAPIVIERVSGLPAVVKNVFVIETLEGDERKHKRQRLDHHQAAGLVVQARDIGGVYGVRGTVVDNRAVLLFTPTLPSPLPPALAALRPVPLELMETPPVVQVACSAGDVRLVGGAVRLTSKEGIVVERVEHSIGYPEHGFEDRQLRDVVVVVADKLGLLAVVNLVDENAMVAGVLPSEMFANAPIEALKAQAVTARGELFSKVGRRHFADPFLVCSEQHCQVYRGLTAETPRTNEAASATDGELAFLDGHVVESVYSACCGGHSEAADVVWDRPARRELQGRADGPDPPHKDHPAAPWLEKALGFHTPGPGGLALRVQPKLKSDDDVRAFLALPRETAWCGRSTFNQKGTAWRWDRRFSVAELNTLCAGLHVGAVQRLSIPERGDGGRLRALLIEGSAGSATVLRELPVRRLLGNLKSGLFVIDPEYDANRALAAVTLRGAGYGHGSGMCQQGAIGMAEAGARYPEILAHAYNGAVVRKVF